MALFSRKQKTDEAKPQESILSAAPAPATAPKKGGGKHASKILLSPRVTEKGAYIAQEGVYVFNVHSAANKQEIAQAVKTIYNVSPRMVRIVTIPRKVVATRGTNRFGTTAGGKKAYVYLKKGETIEVI